MSTRLSVVLIAKNAADLLPDCGLRCWADEIILLDSGSEDNTADVARAAVQKSIPTPTGKGMASSASARRDMPPVIMY